MRDYYYILGITSSATDAEVKTAYRKLSLKFHPDKNSGDKYFEERFKDIQEAYDTLSNSTNRKEYDFKLNQYRSSKINRESLKNREEELRKKYEKEFIKREEEIKKTFSEKENALKEEANRNKINVSQKNSPLLILILAGVILAVGLILFQTNQQNKLREENLKSLKEKAVIDSIKTAKELQAIKDKLVQDSIRRANEEIMRIIEKVEADQQEESPELMAPTMSDEELNRYYENGRNDPNIKLFRKKINQYLQGELFSGDEIDQTALDSMNYYGREYLESKFFLAYIENAKYGGKWMQIVFINKPDKAFFVWSLHGRIAGFGDAQWKENAIRMVQSDEQMLNPKYGF